MFENNCGNSKHFKQAYPSKIFNANANPTKTRMKKSKNINLKKLTLILSPPKKNSKPWHKNSFGVIYT